MVRLRGPLHSLKASKKFADLLVFKTYGNRNILTKYSFPSSKKPFTISTGQTNQRNSYADAVEAWNDLTDEQKEEYNTEAKGEQYTGYNLFIKGYITDNPVFGDLSYYGNRTLGILIYGKV